MIDPQRLRDLGETLDTCEWVHPLGSSQLCRDAADEIERLRKLIRCEQVEPPCDVADDCTTQFAVELATAKMRIAELEAALRPFAEMATVVRPSDGDDWTFGFTATAKTLRAAAAAMGGAK